MSKTAPAPAPTSPAPAPVAVAPDKGVSSWAVAWRQFRKNKTGMFALGSLIGLGLVAILSPLVANSKPIICSYKGKTFFPAFKDYIDENIPIPFGIAGKLRRTFPGLLSPAYPDAPEIVRPGGTTIPDWRQICREIDNDPARQSDWYLRALVPYYYKENSNSIKQKPFADILALELVDGPMANTAVEVPPTMPWDDIARSPRDPSLPLRAVVVARLQEGTRSRWTMARAAEADPAVQVSKAGQALGATPVPLTDGDLIVIGPRTVRVYVPPTHVLGTDDVGRDVLSRIIHGTVIAGSVGVVSVSLYVLIGIILGACAGYFRGWVDILLSRIIEIVICFPTFFLIITIVAVREPSIYNIMIALGLVSWTGVARLVRGEFLKAMNDDYVQAARALGFGHTRIIFRHILPNAIAPVFVTASFGVAGAILTESSLSFLGFGVAPPTASWGEILQQGRRYIQEDLWHLVWVPGACIFYTVTMFNLLGEGLRDALDPKLRQ